MSRRIAVINRKGGVGKTTTALALAEGLRQRGKSVLMVDLDQQHNSTKQYGAVMEGQATVYDLMTDPKVPVADCIQATKPYGDIIAGDDWMNRAEEAMSRLDSREYILKDALDEVDGIYDYVVVDCPPSLGIVVKNVLVAVDSVIVPVVCDGYSSDSFVDLMKQVDAVRSNRRLNPALEVEGVLLTQYEAGQRLVRDNEAELPKLARDAGTKLFSSRIRRCCKVKEAAQKGVSLFDHAPGCTAAVDYQGFVDELLKVKR